MKICLNCGKEEPKWLCKECKENLTDENRYSGIEMIDKLETPQKEMLIINLLTGYKKYHVLYYSKRELFFNCASICLNSEEISQEDKEHIWRVMFVNKFKESNYEETEKFADLIKEQENLNKYVVYELGKYYIYTRRYDLAKKFIERRIALIDENDSEKIQQAIQESYEEIEKRKNGEMKGYMPASKNNKEKYCEFMKSIGFDVDKSEVVAPQRRTKKQPDKISLKDYPNIKENEITDFNFDTFVAFDLETTGFGRVYSEKVKNRRIDDIIEIAAIKVVNGKIDESEKFLFQELVHPLKQKIGEDVEMLTGITNEMISKAPKIWEVFPKFMEFVGDNILVGFNCINFDCDFLARAGRYSQIIIKNKFYDVYRNLNEFNMKSTSLGELSNNLNITNPNAHRALADAITTAKVFLKLKEENANNETNKEINNKLYIKIIGGTNQESDSIEEIWENLIIDCDKKEEKIIRKLMKECTNNIEKPIYSPTVEIINKKQKITVNELWSNAKVMLFLSENEEDYNIAKKTGWNCFMINEEFNIKEFLRSIER